MPTAARKIVATLAWLAAIAAANAASPQQPPALLRCGWFINPTPANAFLNDRDGEWIVGVQGGHQAKGDWPIFKDHEWVRFGHANYGYGCACLRLQAKAKTREVAQIYAATARPLAACRSDPALKDTEPGAGR